MKKKMLIFMGLLLMSFNVYASALTDFETFFDNSISKPLRVIAVILFVVMTTADYILAVLDKEASSKKANSRLLKRTVALVVLFFAENIIDFITLFLR